jgi:hypothetical protein
MDTRYERRFGFEQYCGCLLLYKNWHICHFAHFGIGIKYTILSFEMKKSTTNLMKLGTNYFCCKYERNKTLWVKKGMGTIFTFSAAIDWKKMIFGMIDCCMH